ncbi:enoyl-CoA hydratase-related protein [Sphingomonas solaris]|uniref:Enoyl-CoA hydratase n=1 Tax=Alterirhizorhabdus solaris TaxID=2529389 RepID=A0A558RBF5_9SPHN|nr:enoyl-CoA hydratase-related protein [Sphingomonas solaris]TVV76745.1 enoyl-CoA hydratase [Sphingomonas solaris]
MGDAADEPPVLLAVAQGVATITLNRPAHGNGWTAALSRAYAAALEGATRDPAVRAVVLTGAGRAFSVGGDAGGLGAVAEQGAAAPLAATPYWLPLASPKPVIAAVNGACFGIGMQQALCCDIRIASDDAKFSTAYARRGLVAEYGMSWLLPRLVGTGNAMDLLLSARLVRAEEAGRIGLVNRVVPAADLLAEATDYARQLATQCSPGAMAAIKRQCLRDLTTDFPTSYATAEALLQDAFAGDDFREGMRSWQAQRPPAFPPLPAGHGMIPPWDDDAFMTGEQP